MEAFESELHDLYEMAPSEEYGGSGWYERFYDHPAWEEHFPY
jgi:hypothetical protein